MGTHTELVGKTAYFANAKFQTSKCQATVQKCAQRKIEQFTISQPAAKRVKSSKDGMAQMREMLAMTTTNLNLSLAAGAEQAKQHTKLIESINTKDAHVTRLLEQKDTDQEMIKTLVGTVTSVQPLAAAQETKNRLEAFLGKSTNPN